VRGQEGGIAGGKGRWGEKKRGGKGRSKRNNQRVHSQVTTGADSPRK